MNWIVSHDNYVRWQGKVHLITTSMRIQHKLVEKKKCFWALRVFLRVKPNFLVANVSHFSPFFNQFFCVITFRNIFLVKIIPSSPNSDNYLNSQDDWTLEKGLDDIGQP